MSEEVERQIQEAGANNPRITPAQIEALKARLVYTDPVLVEGTTTVVVHAFLDGAFRVASGYSACVDPANFRQHIGEGIARHNAERDSEEAFWGYEGYRLYRASYEPAQPE